MTRLPLVLAAKGALVAKRVLAAKKDQEANELFREGSKKDGVLSSQPTEPIASYTQRRRRWHTRLIKLDGGFRIPEKVQIEMLLDGAGLTYDQGT